MAAHQGSAAFASYGHPQGILHLKESCSDVAARSPKLVSYNGCIRCPRTLVWGAWWGVHVHTSRFFSHLFYFSMHVMKNMMCVFTNLLHVEFEMNIKIF